MPATRNIPNIPPPPPAPPNPAPAFTLGGSYDTPDGGKTRTFTYNGRKIVSHNDGHDFPGKRIHKLPIATIEFASSQPLTTALLPCRLGYFPNAAGQKVTRPNGDWAYTLLFCLDGAGHLRLGRHHHRMTPGTLALLRPFEPHTYEADPKTPWSLYWIHFNGTQAPHWYDVLTTAGKHPCVTLRPDANFVETFEKILDIYRDGHAYKMLVRATAALHQLLGDLCALLSDPSGKQETAEVRVRRTIEIMRHNPGLHMSIQKMASLANMSHAYYATQFRKQTGEPPRAHFNKLKIEKARGRLAATNDKIENIARQAGFDDLFYFCRLFKRLTGQTPGAYRASARKPTPEK